MREYAKHPSPFRFSKRAVVRESQRASLLFQGRHLMGFWTWKKFPGRGSQFGFRRAGAAKLPAQEKQTQRPGPDRNTHRDRAAGPRVRRGPDRSDAAHRSPAVKVERRSGRRRRPPAWDLPLQYRKRLEVTGKVRRQAQRA